MATAFETMVNDELPNRISMASNPGATGYAKFTGTSKIIEFIKSNFAASAAPTVNDDTTQGYVVGSWWFDTTGNETYVCTDVSTGAAVWKQAGASDHIAAANPHSGSASSSDLTAHTSTTTDAHGSTQAASVAFESPSFQNSGGAVQVKSLNEDITIDALHHGATRTVFVKNSGVAGALANLDVQNDIVVGGTVDGRDVAADGAILDVAILDTDFNAKGDLLTATANDTPAILTVGADAQVLTADSAQAGGIKWAAAAGGAANHNLLDGSVHPDTVAAAVSRGALVVGNATPKWDGLTIGAAGQILRSDGTDIAWADPAPTWTQITGKLHQIDKPFFAPDYMQDKLPIIFLKSKLFPFGATVKHLSITFPANTTYSLPFIKATGTPPSWSETTIKTLTVSAAAFAEEDDGNYSLPAGSYLFVDVPATDADWVHVCVVLQIDDS